MRKLWRISVLFLIIAGCGSRQAPPPVAPTPADEPPTIVFLGDSLTSGHGVNPEQAYPMLIADKLKAEGLSYHVVNAGISGDTTAGGMRRTTWLMKGNIKVLVLALGANDGLRGVPVAETKKNLDTIIQVATGRNVKVLLVGMKLPMNYGADYRRAFEQVFTSLAKQYDVTYLPFLLEGVAMSPKFTLDGLHPNGEGQKRVAEHVWKALRPLLVFRDGKVG